MDKVYIKTRDLDVYDYMRLENIKNNLGLDIKDIISLEELIRILESLYNEYEKIYDEFEEFKKYIDRKDK